MEAVHRLGVVRRAPAAARLRRRDLRAAAGGRRVQAPSATGGLAAELGLEGLLPRFRRTYVTRNRDEVPRHLRAVVDELVVERLCPDCGGTRLNPRALSSAVAGHTIADLSRMELDELLATIRGIDAPTVAPVLEVIEHRLRAMVDLGLGHLSLDRVTTTLSGGESQRRQEHARPCGDAGR